MKQFYIINCLRQDYRTLIYICKEKQFRLNRASNLLNDGDIKFVFGKLFVIGIFGLKTPKQLFKKVLIIFLLNINMKLGNKIIV